MTPTRATLWGRLARRLGLDGNPLRRRSDIVAAWLLPAAVVAFLSLCPVVAGVTSSWIRADNAAVQRAELTWHKVTAVLLQSAPGPEESDGGVNTWMAWTPAKWNFDGRQHTGQVPVAAQASAGSKVVALLDRTGQVMTPPLNAAQVTARIDMTASLVMAVVTVLLAGLALLAARILDNRRLAGWEADWLAVGPRWSRHGS